MALIVKKGDLPKTPHTEFYFKKDVLALEEIHGAYGFSGAYSRKMHVRRYPTEQSAEPEIADFQLKAEAVQNLPLQPFHVKTGQIPTIGDFWRSRVPLIVGPSTVVSTSKPNQSSRQDEFFRNGEAHELVFVQEGAGELLTEYGRLKFRPGLYIVIPKGTTTQWKIDGKAFFLVIESLYPITFPPHYMNPQGQATLSAPVVETEIGLPELDAPKDETGRFTIYVKHNGGRVSKLTLGHHPFDVCGWEGALYPFTFDSADHHSVAREIHTAPPARQTFQAGTAPHNGFSICTFRSQVEGWHPKDIPAPYAHLNADSDEVMFFSNTTYGAREGVIEPGSMTFHPGSLPHSPQGDAAKRSMATRGKVSDYLAVMLDTFFESLAPTEAAVEHSDRGYPLSWKR